MSEFARDYPGWRVTTGICDVLEEIHAVNRDVWLEGARRFARGAAARVPS